MFDTLVLLKLVALALDDAASAAAVAACDLDMMVSKDDWLGVPW